MTNIATDLIEREFDTRYEKELRRSSRKKIRKQQQIKNQKLIDLRHAEPRTENQAKAFDIFDCGKNMLLHGVAGTGKTFISLYLAVDDIFNGEDLKKQVVIVRSAVPTRDMGFLPGKESEKTAIYEAPYQDIMSQVTTRGDGYDILKQRGVIKFITTSYIRGTTLDNSIVLVDECQNMTFHELDSIITRTGENTRIIFCGDFRQTDLRKPNDQSGIKEFMTILKTLNNFGTVEFNYDDIVRSGLVKQYIMAKDKINDNLHTLRSA